MFEHVDSAVYIPSDDVIFQRLDVFRELLSGQFMLLDCFHWPALKWSSPGY